jgi:hypothetical protein
VPANTDCAISPGNPWDYWNGYFLFNAAEYPGAGTVNVCEHTYDRGNGDTVSDRCGNNYKSSETDLEYYWDHSIELSGHAGNNSSTSHTIDGRVTT